MNIIRVTQLEMKHMNNIRKYIETISTGNTKEKSAVIAKADVLDMLVSRESPVDIAHGLITIARLVEDNDERSNLLSLALTVASCDTTTYIAACLDVKGLLDELEPHESATIMRKLKEEDCEGFMLVIDHVDHLIHNTTKTMPEDYVKYTPESSSIDSYRYSSFTRHLWIIFKNSKWEYLYKDVPKSVALDLHNAKSKGRYVQEHIVDGGYKFVKRPKPVE